MPDPGGGTREWTGRTRAMLGSLILLFVLLGSAQIFFGQAARGVSSIHRIGNDDAYISFRYALNLAAGHGLVWNPGERVEGYSNLLHVLAAAALVPVVGADSLYVAMAGLGLAILAIALLPFARALFDRYGARAAIFSTALLVCAPTLWAAPASGLETAMVLAAQLLLVLAVERLATGSPPELRRLAPVVLALLALILLRADGFVSLALVLGHFVLLRRFRLALATAAMVLPGLAALFLWRLVYYGTLLPNPFHAKVDGPLAERLGHALVQFGALCLDQGLWIYVLALALVPAFRWRGALAPGIPFASSYGLGTLGYWFLVGGDHFGERFLLVVVPLGIAAGLEMGARLPRRTLAFCAALAFLLQLRPLLHDERFSYSSTRYDGWIRAGRFLGERHPGAYLAVDAAGKIPYFSGLRALDMRGLTDAHIARTPSARFDNPGHDKFDAAYVLRRRPDLIAAWIDPRLDMSVGLSRELYEAAGYRLRYLINASRTSIGDDIVDLAGSAPERIENRILRTHRLGVLERVDGVSAPASPAPAGTGPRRQ